MISNIETQFISLAVSVYAGLIIGLLFDLYRTLNYYARPSKTFLHLMDLLFWAITSIVVFIILLNADFAELRIYTFMGMIAGIFMYLKLFSGYVLKFYRTLIYLIIKAVRGIIILVTLPFKLLYNILWAPFNYIKKVMLSAGNIIAGKIKGIAIKFDKKK